jgi:hypothetical protein
MDTVVQVKNETPAEPGLSSLLRLFAFPWFALLFLIIILFGLVRYHLRDMPLERDEGEYAFAGQLMLQGIPPYKLAYNMKLPGTYAAYAAILAAFGETPAGIHLGLLLVNAVTSLLLYFLAARLFGRLAGVVAGASYALLSTSSSVEGFQAHATNFVVLPAILGILLLLHALQSGRLWLFLVSGLVEGIAFLMKQHGVFIVLFCFLYLVVSARERQCSPRKILRYAALFALGAILPYAATVWLLYWSGVFGQFWFWTVSYAVEYSKMGPHRAVRAFLMHSRAVVGPAAPVWVLAAIGITAPRWNPSARKHSWFLTALLLFSFLAICPGAYFRRHYFVLLLPEIAILVGVAVSAATEVLGGLQKPKYLIVLPSLAFLACFGSSVFLQRAFCFCLDPEKAMRATYKGEGAMVFLAARKTANYVKNNSSPSSRIAVLGSEPEIYFYANRHSATGYIYMYALTARQTYTARMRQQMIQEIETCHPDLLVYVDDRDSWNYVDASAPQVVALLSWAQEYMQNQYERVGVVDIGESIQYVWGDAARTYRPRSDKAMYVLRRKVE